MSCTCTIDEWDGEPSEFHHVVVMKARKSHKCYECGGEIKKGDKYELKHVKSVWKSVTVFVAHIYMGGCGKVSRIMRKVYI